MADVKVKSIATIKFMSDGSLITSLSSPNGITARMLENVATALYNKLSELRAIERRKEMARVALEDKKQRELEEQRKLDAEKVNA